MDDLVGAAKIRVLVPDRVETMGTARDDPRHPVSIQGLDVRPDHGLREVLVPESTCGIPRTFLLGSQDRESHARPPEGPGKGLRDLPVAVIGGRRAADPREDLAWFGRCDGFCSGI